MFYSLLSQFPSEVACPTTFLTRSVLGQPSFPLLFSLEAAATATDSGFSSKALMHLPHNN